MKKRFVRIKTCFGFLIGILVCLVSCREGQKTKRFDADMKQQTEEKIAGETGKDEHLSNQLPQIKLLSEKIAEDSTNAELFFTRAGMYRKAGNLEAAAVDYADAILLDSLNAVYYLSMSDLYFQDKKLPLAISILEKARKTIPKNVDIVSELGKFYFYTRNYKKAEENLDKAISLAPKNAYPYFWKGMMLRELDKTGEAITQLKKASGLNENFYEPNMILGELYYDKNDPSALKYYDKAIAIDSLSTEAHYAKAMFYQNNNQTDKALDEYKILIRKDPQFADAYFNTGYLLTEKKEYKKALQNFNIAIRVSPTMAKAYFMRGKCAENLGRMEDAKKDYENALVFDKNLLDAREALERIKE